jgi:hypothetical protein
MIFKRVSGIVILVFVLILVSIPFFMALSPFGATVYPIRNMTAQSDQPQSHAAIAGNITEMDIFGYTVTSGWQGYFGNVTGQIFLADASDNIFYNWSVSQPEGEVYASINDSIFWSMVQCLNFTADGTYADDTSNRGNTSAYGKNLSQINAEYNFSMVDGDAINQTFSLTGTHENGRNLAHDLFYTANLRFDAGECLSTHLMGPGATFADGTFQEVLLYEPTTTSLIFTSILDEEEPLGFDNARHDFQMLVLENGHNTDTMHTTYYFYVELE